MRINNSKIFFEKNLQPMNRFGRVIPHLIEFSLFYDFCMQNFFMKINSFLVSLKKKRFSPTKLFMHILPTIMLITKDERPPVVAQTTISWGQILLRNLCKSKV